MSEGVNGSSTQVPVIHRHQRRHLGPTSEVPLTSLPPTVQDQSALPRVPRARDWLDAVREPTGIGRQSDDAVLVTFDDRMCVHCSALNMPMRSRAASSRSRAAHPHVPPPVRGRHTHTCLVPFAGGTLTRASSRSSLLAQPAVAKPLA